ncbi:MAG: hypothetical protein WAL28_08520 [Nitrososphaeraceae archaeon]
MSYKLPYLIKNLKRLAPNIYSDYVRVRKRTLGKSVKSDGNGPFHDPEIESLLRRERA